jgi:hypothetical protein
MYGDLAQENGPEAMKISMLLMLIGVIVSMSYIPIRRTKPAAAPSPDSVPAEV